MKEKEYEALVDMFASDGWKSYMNLAQNLEESLTRGAVDNAPDNDRWQYLRGQLGQLRSILGYETAVHAMWKQQQEDALEDVSEVEENASNIV